MAVGQVSFKDNKKVKRILVPQRENPIVNRLNKTKVEKYPDLKQEKDDHLRELRKKDQAAQQARVSSPPFTTSKYFSLTTADRKRKKPASPRSARKRSGKRTTPTTNSSPTKTWPARATRIATRTGRMISCSSSAQNQITTRFASDKLNHPSLASPIPPHHSYIPGPRPPIPLPIWLTLVPLIL